VVATVHFIAEMAQINKSQIDY